MQIFSKNAFGLDIGDSSLKLIWLDKHKAIKAYNSMKIPAGLIEKGVIKNKQAVVKAIKELISKAYGQQITTNKVIACLPEPKTFVKLVEVPARFRKKELEQEIYKLVPDHFPLDIENAYIDWQFVAKKRSKSFKSQVLIGVAARDTVDQYVDLLESAELYIEGLQIEATAIVNALIKAKPKKAASITQVIIDLGRNRNGLIFVQDGIIQFTLSLKKSASDIVQELAQQLSITPEEAEKKKNACGLNQKECPDAYPIIENHYNQLAEELNRSIEFYKKNYEQNVTSLILSGGEALTKNLTAFLEVKTKIKPVLADPFTNIRIKKIKKSEDWLFYTTAIGLAMSSETKI